MKNSKFQFQTKYMTQLSQYFLNFVMSKEKG